LPANREVVSPGKTRSPLSRILRSSGSAGGTRPTSFATTGRRATAGKIVVDTSVLIKWFKTRDEDLLKEARALLDAVETRALEVHVPALLLYEVGNILLLKTRLGLAGLHDVIERLEALPFIVVPPATPLLKRAARLGRELELTFYDASFLALAAELDCPYITADRRLFERTRTLARVRHLARVGALP
jgi:predicted nucleic acid-binding protein